MAKEKPVKSPSCTFAELAELKSLPVQIGDVVVGHVVPKRFSTGSYGLGLGGPVTFQLPGGKLAECSGSINITVKHSKPQAKAA